MRADMNIKNRFVMAAAAGLGHGRIRYGGSRTRSSRGSALAHVPGRQCAGAIFSAARRLSASA